MNRALALVTRHPSSQESEKDTAIVTVPVQREMVLVLSHQLGRCEWKQIAQIKSLKISIHRRKQECMKEI